MFEHVLIPLMLVDHLNGIKGRTRFQKLVFLVQRSAEKEKVTERFDLDFEIYLHGPFSQDLSLTIDDLVHRLYLHESIEQISPNYEMHIYKLTNKGRDVIRDARSKKLVSEKLIRIVRETCEKYGTLPLAQLVEEAYRQF